MPAVAVAVAPSGGSGSGGGGGGADRAQLELEVVYQEAKVGMLALARQEIVLYLSLRVNTLCLLMQTTRSTLMRLSSLSDMPEPTQKMTSYFFLMQSTQPTF